MCRSNSTTLIAAITLIAVCGGCGRNQDIPVEIKKAETAKVGAASGGDKLDAPGNDIEGTWTVTGKPMEECVICRIDGQGHIAFNFLRLEIVGAMDDPEPMFFVYYDPKDPSKVLFPGGHVGHGNLQAAQAGTLLVEAGKLVMTLPGQEKVQLTRVRAGIDAEMRNKIRHLTPPSATDEGRTALARLTARKFSIDQRLGFGMVLKAPAGSTVTNDDIQDMIALRQVVELDLSKTAVNDAQMAAIARIDRLDRLILNYTSITDIGLEHLNNLRRLNTLTLEGTAITDAGL